MAGNERTNVKTYPTALPTDVLFYVLADWTLPKNRNFPYGTSYRECLPHAAENFPDHELVYIAPDDGSGKQKWYFAAKRENQDSYNYEIQSGEQLVRFYLIKRELYRERPDDVEDAAEGEFLYPPAGAESPDIVFTNYCFVDDTVVRAERELDSLYVAVRRRFIRPVTVDIRYDERFKRNIRITKEVIPFTTASPALPESGVIVEIQDGNAFHSVRITSELILEEDDTYPYAISTVPISQDKRFPARLDSVSLVGAWAWASSTGFADSYSEDYYFKFKYTEPRPGPYEGRLLRFITDDPDALRSTYPVTIVPQPISETIGVTAAWFYASSVHGNKTSAVAREWSVPATIHPLITIDYGGTGETSKSQDRTRTETLAATPGYATFAALTQCIIDYRVQAFPLGLYEVSIVIVEIGGLYDE